MKSYTLKNLPRYAVYDHFDSPLGKHTIIASHEGLHAVLWEEDDEKNFLGLSRNQNNKILLETKIQLSEYFQHKRKIFDLPIATTGTDFQLKTWEILSKIPYGMTMTYGEQAQKLGDKNKARAVGAANGLNPISIIIPCHRVVGANGKLTGFRGGMDRKQFLLDFEK